MSQPRSSNRHMRTARRGLLEALARRDVSFALAHRTLAADAGSEGGYARDLTALPMPPLFNW